MRILIDCRHLNQKSVSGIGEYTIQLLHALFDLETKRGLGTPPIAKDPIEYILLTTGKEKPDLLSLFKDRSTATFQFPAFVKHAHVPVANKFLNFVMLLRKQPSIEKLVSEKVDLIFLPNLNITILPKDIPTVLMIHDLSWKFFPEFYSWKMRLWHRLLNPENLVETCRTIITPSESAKHDVETVFHKAADVIEVIPHGVDPSFQPQLQATDHGARSRLKLPKRYALFVGTIEPRKNVLSLIEGMKLYREQTHDDLHLVLVGPWGWRSHNVRRRLWKQDAQGWIHELGYIPAKDRPALYRSASVFVWPSFYEGFGLPVLEAMASGCPVITSHTSSMPELTGTAAIHIDPFNTQDIADALQGVISSKSLQEQLKKAEIDRAKEYTWKKAAEATLAIFEKPLI